MLPRELPALPAWFRAEYGARPPAGTDLVEVAARERQRADRNASIIERGAVWYGERRRDFAKGGDR